MTLSEHDGKTGKYSIYASRTGELLLTGTASWVEFGRIEDGIRKAELVAAGVTIKALSVGVSDFIEKLRCRDDTNNRRTI